MARIDQLTVQRILDTADIVEVVSEFVTLKRRGANYMGLCPFHNERTPSFSVSKSKGICKCFSCGKGGNVVNFLMELQQMSYGEALRWLAAKYGIEIQEHELTDHERERERERESILAVMDFACSFYKSQLATPDAMRSIASELAISPAVMERYMVGHTGNEPLAQAAVRRGFDPALLTKTGLSDDNGADTASGIILPLLSRYGKPTGIIWRGTPGAAFNICSPIAKPDDEFFGYSQARRAAAKAQRTAIAGTPGEVLALADAGVENALCPLSPGYGERRIATLRKLGNDVVLLLPQRLYWDAYRVMAEANALLREGMSVRVAALPPGTDFRQYLASNTSDTISRLFDDDSTDIVTFKLDRIDQLRHTNGMSARLQADYERYMLTDIRTTLASVSDSILKEIYLDTAAARLHISPDSLLR